MRCRILCAGLLASVAAGGGSAVAADIAVRPAMQPPPPMTAPSYISEWAGFYVGIHGGGGWSNPSFEPQFFGTSTVLAILTNPFVGDVTPNSHGGVFGFQFGHNWQWGPAVGGLEIDFSGADISGTATAFAPAGAINILGVTAATTLSRELKTDQLASARGRLGYVIFPNWLLFGTAGISWGHSRLTSTEVSALAFLQTQTDISQFGWVAGGGLEWKIFDHWLLRGEYLHYDFGKAVVPTDVLAVVSINAPVFSAAPFSINVRNTVDVARAALSYKF